MIAVPTPPLLFLDVDGPLNPYEAKPHRRPDGYLTHRMRPASWVAAQTSRPARYAKPLRVWLNPQHGPQLLALPYTLVWASTWMDEANEWIAPPLGLPRLPVVTWLRMHDTDPGGLHWKSRHLVDWADGRAFAWVDDELTDRDRAWVAQHHRGPALLYRVDARTGLAEQDFAAFAAWARTLPAGRVGAAG